MLQWPWETFQALEPCEQLTLVKNLQSGVRLFSQFAGMDAVSQSLLYMIQQLGAHLFACMPAGCDCSEGLPWHC
eukprot:13308278-Alexandrium_andersonii.AAC.1